MFRQTHECLSGSKMSCFDEYRIGQMAANGPQAAVDYGGFRTILKDGGWSISDALKTP